MWTPEPRDTSAVRLPAEVMALVDQLAEHAHDVWAAGRWREGWRYGRNRDPDRLLTPNMVPYRELPESERRYDRDLALQTLAFLVSLGYQVVGPAVPTSVPGQAPLPEPDPTGRREPMS